MGEAGAEELDEHADHPPLAQHLGDGEHEVGGGGPLGELAGEAEADHLGDQHRHRLAQHGRLGLDAADAPAEDAEAVDHGGVGVGPHQGVRIEVALPRDIPLHDHPRQILQVDLMDDAGVRRHDAEVAERGLPPAQEGVALAVALEFLLGVDQEGGGGAVLVHLHRVVDHQLDRLEGVDPLRIAPHGHHGVAHGRQVDDGGDAGEVLKKHAGRHEGDLPRGDRLRVPAGQGLDLVRGDRRAVLAAQQVLEQDAQGIGETGDVESPRLQRVQSGDVELAPAHPQGRRLPKLSFMGLVSPQDRSRCGAGAPRPGGSLSAGRAQR